MYAFSFFSSSSSWKDQLQNLFFDFETASAVGEKRKAKRKKQIQLKSGYMHLQHHAVESWFYCQPFSVYNGIIES